MINQNTRFPLVQCLRGIAALWVVIFHAGEGGHVKGLTAALPAVVGQVLFEAGHLGVPIFFALSGFVIAHSVRTVDLDGRNYGRFILRRSLRLDPPYWASIAVVTALAFLSAQVKHEPFSVPGVATLSAHVLYLQEILGTDKIGSVYWTLAYEFQFYLFFVGMLVIAQRFPRAVGAIWAGMWILALASAIQLFAVRGLFVNLWSAFFIGTLAYAAVENSRMKVAGILLGVVMLVVQDKFLAVSVLSAGLLWLSATKGWQWGPRPLLWLGTISYSLYLLHNPLTGATGFLAHKVLGTGIVADLAALGLIVAVSIAGAAVFWFVLEQPSHRLSKRIRLTLEK